MRRAFYRSLNETLHIVCGDMSAMQASLVVVIAMWVLMAWCWGDFEHVDWQWDRMWELFWRHQ